MGVLSFAISNAPNSQRLGRCLAFYVPIVNMCMCPVIQCCAQLRTSSDCCLAMFAKWVGSSGQGFQLECAIRMRQQKETMERDAGRYATWKYA